MTKLFSLLISILLFAGTAQPQTIYSRMTAETGNMNEWGTASWQFFQDGGLLPVASSTRAKNGIYSYKYQITVPLKDPHNSQTLSPGPNLVSMGASGNGYTTGYYSFWAYLDNSQGGWNGTNWRMLLGWLTNVSGSPSPIADIELARWPRTTGPLQLNFQLKNYTSGGCGTAPTIPGYQLASNGYYFMTSSSPAGIVQFPTGQWVHVEAYYKMAQSNGQIIIWQDGVKIMDLTAPTFNTFWGHSVTPCTNNAGAMILQFGVYGGANSSGSDIMYVDDFKVTDYQVSGQPPPTLAAPTNLRLSPP